MIKYVLKVNGISLSDFSSNLHLSRPTLDQYIRIFDSQAKIPNPLYQKIFDYLFSDDNLDLGEFQMRYNKVLSTYGPKINLDSISSQSVADTEQQDRLIKALANLKNILQQDFQNKSRKPNVLENIAYLLTHDQEYKNLWHYLDLLRYQEKYDDTINNESSAVIHFALSTKDFNSVDSKIVDEFRNFILNRTNQEQEQIEKVKLVLKTKLSELVDKELFENPNQSLDELIARLKKNL